MPEPAGIPQPVFYYDFGDPESYLIAERIMAALPVVAEWEPVLGLDLGASADEPDRADLERRVLEVGLQPLRWPERWPPDTRKAMLAATYAKGIGRAVTFSLAAFRQAFAGGRDLASEETILLAGAACEMHPTALLKGIALRSTAVALERATSRARLAGVSALPTIEAHGELFRDIESAARALEQA